MKSIDDSIDWGKRKEKFHEFKILTMSLSKNKNKDRNIIPIPQVNFINDRNGMYVIEFFNQVFADKQ